MYFILFVEVGQLKVNDKVMCHPSMKLSDMFDPNPMHTSDKVKHILMKLEHKCQGHIKKKEIWILGAKNMLTVTSKNIWQGFPCKCCATDVSIRLWMTYLQYKKWVNTGKKLTRLIIITAGRFVASKTQIQLV